MRRWFVVIFTVVIVIALLLGGSFQIIVTLLPQAQQETLLPYVGAVGFTVFAANVIILIMSWFQISPLDFLPERTLKDQLRLKEPARFSLSKSADADMLAEQTKAAKNQDQYEWVYVFAEAWIQQKPYDAYAYEMLAEALIKLDELHQAVTVAEKLTKLEPLNHHGYSLLGDAYNALGERDTARHNYERALELAPENYRRFVLIDLAKMYEALGLADKALTVLDELVPMQEDTHSKNYYEEKRERMRRIVEASAPK